MREIETETESEIERRNMVVGGVVLSVGGKMGGENSVR